MSLVDKNDRSLKGSDRQSDQERSSKDRDAAVRPGEVLVVDDMSTIRLMLTQHVRQLGHRVTPAANGREALDLLHAGRFDLVLLDVMMPEMDGYTVLEQIKSDNSLRDIPVVMISGVDEIQSVVQCIEHGAEDYLPKPINATLLKARVNACLEKKRLWDELDQNFRQLQELEKLRDSLTDMIVHDLRTPLTSVLTGLQTLQNLPDLDRETREELTSIAVSAGRSLLGMINDLLDVSKMEAGSMVLDYSDVAVSDLINSAVQQVQGIMRDKNLKLEQQISPGLPRIRIDSEKLRRVLVNLFGNAAKFTPTGGRIRINVKRDQNPSFVLFELSDTGEGIPREAFSRIFEKFGQVEGRRAGRRMSSGLGLTFCKMAIEAHGGSIWVESELGQGSTFWFRIPVRPPSPAVETNPPVNSDCEEVKG